MSKIYKGVIQSLLPQKGFGFITPVWSQEDNDENIFFHLSETRGGKCYIPALASAENRVLLAKKKNTAIYAPKEMQVVFFTIEAQKLANGEVKLIAKKLKDSNHVTDKEAAEADANTEKPSVEELLHPTEETVDLSVTPETIHQTVEVAKAVDTAEDCTEAVEEAETAAVENLEEEQDYGDYEEDEDLDEYEEEYGYLQDEYDSYEAKNTRRYSPKDNSKE